MPLLSSALTEMATTYDAIVIGSGYGGAIAAATLARARRDGAPLRVALLERGEEIPLGEFPETQRDANGMAQIDPPIGPFGDGNGLFHFHRNDDIVVLQGCGLGGTSLINANVSLPPERWVLADSCWPRAIREDGLLEEGFARAAAVLRPTPYPESAAHPPLRKFAALVASGGEIGTPAARVPINVTFDELPGKRNSSGIEQEPCTSCGNCVSGCNVGAKNTLPMNYLPEARADGVEIYCGVDVRHVARSGGRWLVHYQPAAAERGRYDGAPPLWVAAGIVVVAAGSIGSTGVMLRSAERGLESSPRIGARFTGNGDALGFAYNCDRRVNGIGVGRKAETMDPGDRPGPTITGAIDLREGTGEEGLVIEEGALPSALAWILPAGFAGLATLQGTDTDSGFLDELRERLLTLQSLVAGSGTGAMQRTQTFLVMAHDDGEGRMTLEEGRVRIHWSGIGVTETFRRIKERLIQASAALGGTMVPSPLYNKAHGYDLISVHPLGGCVMAERAEDGVVNDRGQVFRGASGPEVYPDLYVLDGSVVPRPLGVNPLLTISAIAERGARLILADRGWTLQERPASRPPPRRDGRREPGAGRRIWFTERLSGHVATGADIPEDHRRAEELGARVPSPCQIVVTITSDDVDKMIDDPTQEAAVIGTVVIPELSGEPMTIEGGRFNLLVDQSPDTHEKRMLYRLPAIATSGERFFLAGHKVVRDDPGADAVLDTTTLLVDVHEGGEGGPTVARGVIRIANADIVRLLRTLSGRGPDGDPSARAVARFAGLFLGGLWDAYEPGVPGL